MLFPTQKTICVDIDNTLLHKNKLNAELIAWLKEQKKNDYDLILWSAQGRQYAEGVAFKYNLKSLFNAIIGKPGFIIDDLGWSWTRHTRWVEHFNLKAKNTLSEQQQNNV